MANLDGAEKRQAGSAHVGGRNSEGPLLLAGDLGGTKTLLSLVRPEKPQTPVFQRSYASGRYAQFAPLLGEFLAAAGEPNVAGAVLAAAGPVDENRCELTNLPWRLEGGALAQQFGLGPVTLVNDFAATARGVSFLPPEAFFVLQAGTPKPNAPAVVLGAGTGLGVAVLLPDGPGQWRVLPGEGGHVGYAPMNKDEEALCEHLRVQHGRATAERILSGPGLVNLYAWMRARQAKPRGEDLGRADNAPESITASALAHPLSLAGEALRMFAACYGAFAGDLALLLMARGGVYLAGGIAPKILLRLSDGAFLEAFHAKAEHAHLMPAFPVHVVMDERAGLLGAAAWACDLNRERRVSPEAPGG